MLENLKKKTPIIFAGDKDFAPIESLEHGEPEGLNVELLHALARAIERDIEIRLMLWTDAQQTVINAEADALTLLRGDL